MNDNLVVLSLPMVDEVLDLIRDNQVKLAKLYPGHCDRLNSYLHRLES